MELDELKEAWNRHDDALDRLLKMNRDAVSRIAIARAESSLGWLRRRVIIALIISIVIVVALGSFNAEHISDPRFLLPGALLQLFATLEIASLVRQLLLLRRAEPEESVVTVQVRTEKLALERMRSFKWTFVFCSLLWLPMLIVGIRSIGFDPYAMFNLTWLAANVAFGVLMIPAVLWIARRLGSRAAESSFVREFLDSFAGTEVIRARAFLAHVAEFRQEGR